MTLEPSLLSEDLGGLRKARALPKYRHLTPLESRLSDVYNTMPMRLWKPLLVLQSVMHPLRRVLTGPSSTLVPGHMVVAEAGRLPLYGIPARLVGPAGAVANSASI